MTWDWQNALAILLAVVAGIYLSRRAYRGLTTSGTACGGCASGCDGTAPKTAGQTVGIDQLLKTIPRDASESGHCDKSSRDKSSDSARGCDGNATVS